MNIERLTFFSPTSIKLPKDVYTTIKNDAWFFHYKKNNESNINGFLNDLIPCLSDYKIDCYQNLISESQENITLIQQSDKIFRAIAKAPYELFKSETKLVSFRINKEHYYDFIKIHDETLATFDVDFTEYIRDLLCDYSTKRLSIRERLLHYKHIKQLVDVIENHYFCTFYLQNEKLTFVPADMVTSPYTNANIIAGIVPEKKAGAILPLAAVKKIVPQNKKGTLTQSDYRALQTMLDNSISNEKRKFSGNE